MQGTANAVRQVAPAAPATHGDTWNNRAVFRSDRVFYHAALDGGNAGWCFTVRGGKVYGPFPSRRIAEHILSGLIEAFKRAGDTGGR